MPKQPLGPDVPSKVSVPEEAVNVPPIWSPEVYAPAVDVPTKVTLPLVVMFSLPLVRIPPPPELVPKMTAPPGPALTCSAPLMYAWFPEKAVIWFAL